MTATIFRAMSAPDLWNRLRSFNFDDDRPALTFAARLARENGWTDEFAARVIEEYRRFVYLAFAAGHPVTPSDQVDQAWHLHLTYTRSYWDRLSGQVLGKPLHHEPTRGGKSEGAKFEDWYSQTKDSYRLKFNADPPADIWPDNDTRFDHDAHCRRVNTADHWVIPRRLVRRGITALGASFAGATALTGCGVLASGRDVTVIAVVIGGAVLLIGLIAIAVTWVLRRSGSASCSGASGCTGGWWFGGCGSDGGSAGPGGSGDSGGSGGTGCSGSGCGGGGCGG